MGIPIQSVVTKHDLEIVRFCVRFWDGDENTQLKCISCRKQLPVGTSFLRIPDGVPDESCPDSAFCNWDCYNDFTARCAIGNEED